MIATCLLLLTFILAPVSIVLSAVTLSAAFYAATFWKVGASEVLELIVFYGAIAGVVVSFVGV